VAHARARGIGVLIDLHALPGGANKANHSGTNGGVAALWNNKANLALAHRCLVFIAQEIYTGSMDGVVGLQLCNEAEWNAPGLYQWYDAVISAISAIDSTIPLYISDAWDISRAVKYAKDKNKITLGSFQIKNPICVDTHMYYCFTDDNKSPQQIITSIPNALNQVDSKNNSVINSGAAQIVIGEWSCTLSGATWSKIGNNDNREDLTLKFGRVQCQRWQEQAAGSFFWTYNMDWMDGGDWGFVHQTKSKAISAPSNLLMNAADVDAAVARAKLQKTERGKQSCDAHADYWHRTSPGKAFEHWRFQTGWDVGWNDALMFFSTRVAGGVNGSGGDKIGCLDLWLRKRIGESGMVGPSVWEFEQGMRKGISNFYECVRV
jgi:aryl-phospho-beta-D-glucosidase BglC (GH1 family)